MVENTTGINEDELINWFRGLDLKDKLKLYEGRESLEVYNY